MKKRTKQIQVLCVEDGSVDIDALEQDGLKDGKVIVYRQGSREPFVLTLNTPDYERIKKEEVKAEKCRTIERLKSEVELYYTALKIICDDYRKYNTVQCSTLINFDEIHDTQKYIKVAVNQAKLLIRSKKR